MTLRVTLRVTLLKKGSLASAPYTLDFSEKCEGVIFFVKCQFCTKFHVQSKTTG